MDVSVPASFINVDLEIEAAFDLTPLAQSLGDEFFVLFCGEDEGVFRLSVEARIDNSLSGDHLACTAHLLNSLENLPAASKLLLQASTLKLLDYGFDGGVEEIPFRCDVSASLLGRMASLALGMRITVYPFRAADPTTLQGGCADV